MPTPTFPNMSTLTLGAPVGTEEIQISATRKTTLNQIAALFKSLALTGFDPDGSPRIFADIISEDDSLLEAIEKLFDRVGGGSIAIYPFITNNFKAIVSLYNGTVFGFRVQDNSLYFGFRAGFEPDGLNSDISGLYEYITTWNRVMMGDSLLSLGNPGEFWLNPGQQVSLTTAPGNNCIMINQGLWDPSSGKILSASILSTVNITKAMFGTGGTGEMVFIFSENFDDNPGTTYQIVSVQEYIVGGNRILAVNKNGYIPR